MKKASKDIKFAQLLSYQVREKLYFFDVVLNHSNHTEELHNADTIKTIAKFMGELHDDVLEIEDIILNLVAAEESNRLPRLERFMESLAGQMEEEPEDWNFKAAAANIRSQLAR